MKASIRRVAAASFIGTTIEWYDFFLYGTATALVFNKLYFPTFEPWAGTLAAFGTYAVGFAARPLGGIVCGHYGDRIGRKSMLVLTLLVMGVATFLIGLLPTYATIGVWAPVLLILLRIAQGFAVGGEWGGAVLMAVEHSPKGRKGFYGSWPQMGVPAGLLLSAGAFRLVSRLPEDQFLAWGWRVTFLASLALVAVGLFIRLSVEETPEFERVRREGAESKLPVLDTLREHPKEVLLAMGTRFAETGGFYIFSVFVLTYATKMAGVPASRVLGALLLAAAIELFTEPLFGMLCDRVGRRPVLLFGAACTAALAFPFFWLIDTGDRGFIALALIFALPVCHASTYVPQASFFSELFGTRLRYSGASLGYQLAGAVAGGLCPFIAVSLLAATHASWPVSLLLIGISAVSAVSVLMLPETLVRESLDQKLRLY
jgi:metabolite-proton symporter